MKITKLFLSLLLLCLAAGSLQAQVTIGDEKLPNDFSVLELISSQRGLRLPQMTTTQRNYMTNTTAFQDVKATDARGLTIFNTTTKYMEYWNGTRWVSAMDDYVEGYYIKNNGGVKRYFDSVNTSLSNFSTTGNATDPITINGKDVVKNTITEIYFGTSYKDVTVINNFLRQCTALTSIDLSILNKVTVIGNHFLYNCRGLTSLDLSPLSKVTSIGNYFLFDCQGLTSLDLSPLSNVTNIENYFLYSCTSLTSIQIGEVDWTDKNVGSYPMLYIPNTDACTLYADTEELAAKFKTKMDTRISNWVVSINP